MTMYKRTNRVGSEEQYGPRTAGQKNLHTNTDLCVDLKTTLISDRIAKLGKNYQGMLKHDQDYHYTFIETASEKKKSNHRTPLVYEGKCVNVHLKDDGTLFPTLNRPQFNERLSFVDFCTEAAAELFVVSNHLGKERKC